MIPILYDKNESAFSSNGLGRLRDIISCEVTEGRNDVYEVDFEYPVDGANFDEIIPGRVIACTHDDTGNVQPFDIVSFSKPIDGIVQFHGVHISYRLNKAVTYAKNINSLADAFAQLTGQSTTPFVFSADFTGTAYVAAFDGVPKTVRQYLGGVEGSILDTFGGEYEFDKLNVILHQARGERKNFAIRYGVNLVDYTNETDYTDTFTIGVPYWLGQNKKGEDVCKVGNVADPGLVSFIGRPIEAPLDLSEKFEEIPTAAQLQTEALAYMSNNKVEQPAENITVDFVRLQDFEEYSQYKELLACKLCDSIRVIYPQYGEDRWLKIVRVVYDVLADRYKEMELGGLSTSLSDALGISSGGSFVEGDVLGGLFEITTMDVSVPVISAHSYKAAEDYTVPVASRVDGYNLAGIVGVQPSNFRVNSQRHYVVDNTTINAGFHNVTATDMASAGTVTFYLLWLKGTKV